MEKLYTLETRKRGSRITYNVLVLIEYSMPDKHGCWQRGRVIANFGNADKEEVRRDAEFVKEAFEKVALDN